MFCPNNVHDSTRTEVNSIKKLRKGNAAFTVVKKVLGWDVNILTHHLCITPLHLQHVEALLASVHDHHHTPGKKWHKLLGKFHSLGPGVPGGASLCWSCKNHTQAWAQGPPKGQHRCYLAALETTIQ